MTTLDVIPLLKPRDAADPASAIHFGIAIPQTAPDGIDIAAEIRRFSRAAERLGFDGLWARDRIQGPEPLLEPLPALATAAAATTRVRLGVAVIIVPLRAPVELARTSAALDRLSGGRLELGIGLGVDRERVRSVGLEPSRRVGRLLDTVDVLRALWTGESVSIEGRTLAIREWMTRPTPLQPRPRIWFGGHHPDAWRRAVELGDGWIEAGSTSQSDFVREIAVVREHLAAVGRDEATFGLGKRLYLGVERRGRDILEETRNWFAHGYGRAEMADRVAVIGPPSRVTEGVLDILAQGARLVILNPLIDEAAQLRLLAEEVVPAVREALRAQGLANPRHVDPVASVGATVSAH